MELFPILASQVTAEVFGAMEEVWGYLVKVSKCSCVRCKNGVQGAPHRRSPSVDFDSDGPLSSDLQRMDQLMQKAPLQSSV